MEISNLCCRHAIKSQSNILIFLFARISSIDKTRLVPFRVCVNIETTIVRICLSESQHMSLCMNKRRTKINIAQRAHEYWKLNIYGDSRENEKKRLKLMAIKRTPDDYGTARNDTLVIYDQNEIENLLTTDDRLFKIRKFQSA
jgi:hypothetical protein